MEICTWPARALAQKEALFEELGYRDEASQATLVIESGRTLPDELVAKVAGDCGLPDRFPAWD